MGVIESISQLGLAFFGLTYDIVPQARVAIFSQIHEICFHGKGGYDWNTIYEMPIWLRKFTFNKIKKFYEEESNPGNKNNERTTLVDSSGKVNVPGFLKANENNKKPAKYK